MSSQFKFSTSEFNLFGKTRELVVESTQADMSPHRPFRMRHTVFDLLCRFVVVPQHACQQCRERKECTQSHKSRDVKLKDSLQEKSSANGEEE